MTDEQKVREAIEEAEALIALVRVPTTHIAFRRDHEREALRFARETLPILLNTLSSRASDKSALMSASAAFDYALEGNQSSRKVVSLQSLLRGRSLDEEPRVKHTCSMGVGCEEAGICFAQAQGCPEQCGKNDQAALSHASAIAEECSVDDRGAEPGREALSLMNGSLCKFGMNWLLDGDYLRCRVCKRPQIASCAHMDFPHAAWCKVANDVDGHPWMTLIGLLKPITIDQAIAAKRGG